ncbi:diguanylate cyclase domain-containing protein [Saccharomonospora xinjiangensis]|uniref:PAS domain S-box/diguanylate cyclase (GGDEF) domain-containing protein n=1 Tax=Saccharomonospora xinjiangensis XJ-54 TaxID=882086 RepID=I0UX80_9PSEU|nr:diguanylate cyclase [Saccharomonospora xinjiangensis]EID52483.1 PAS domain S-box/diguanylate cyclase (GGDEF) domain-containing protein [Saccharomonospora xinjiangensis XJ-54]
MPEPGDTPGLEDIARRWAARLTEIDGVSVSAETLRPSLLALAREAQAEAWTAHDAAVRRFSDLYAASPVGVVLGDADGTIRDVNPAFVELVHHTRSDLVGHPLTRLAATAADAKILASVVEEALLPARRPRQERITVTHGRDGTLRARVTVATITADGPGLPHPVLMIEDVHELDLLSEQLRRQNVQDPLTGLPNSYHFENKLDTALATAQGGRVALVYFDIDGFKVINDGLGPGAGDEVLRQVARKLGSHFTGQCGHEAVVARLSGDGFAVLLHGRSDSGLDTATVVDLVEDSMRELAEPVYVDGKGVGVNVSVGIVVTEAAGRTSEELHRAAEITLHRAKENGKAQWMLFEQDLHDRDRRRFGIGAAIGGGLENGQFAVDYEPTVTLDDHERVAVVNAQLRWDHPDHGVLRSRDFSDLADTTGMTPALGELLLALSMTDAAAWHHEFGDAPDLCVRLPARLANDPNLVRFVRTELDRTGLPPNTLRICTDSVTLIEPRGEVLENLSILAELGVKITLAVSGAADLELIHRHRLPVGFVIVSGTLVDALAEDDESMQSAHRHFEMLMIRARELKIARVGVEGVRSFEHARRLAALGVVAGRGPLFGEETGAASIRSMLAKSAGTMRALRP